MRIAITGATGFLGRDLLARLRRAGHRLVCTRYRQQLLDKHLDDPSVDWVAGSFTEADTCARLTRDCDALVHAARHGARGGRGESPADYLEKNVLGTLTLLEAACESGIKRIIIVSSSAVSEISLKETAMSKQSLSLYTLMKASVEMVANYLATQKKGVQICCLRPSAMLGVAPERSSVEPYTWARQIVDGEPLRVTRGHRRWVHVEDVSRAVQFLLEQHEVAQGHFDCFDPSWPSGLDIAHMIARIAGADSAKIDCSPDDPEDCRRPEALSRRGFLFSGLPKLEETLRQFVEEVRNEKVAPSRPMWKPLA